MSVLIVSNSPGADIEAITQVATSPCASMLTQTATILRRAAGTDAHGQASGSYSAIATNVPCRLSAYDGRRVAGNMADGALTLLTIYFAPGLDVRATDRVQIVATEYAVDDVTTNAAYTAAKVRVGQ